MADTIMTLGKYIADMTAKYIRHTQFAGSHPYCEEHAKLEKDFNDMDILENEEILVTNMVNERLV